MSVKRRPGSIAYLYLARAQLFWVTPQRLQIHPGPVKPRGLAKATASPGTSDYAERTGPRGV